MSQRYKLRQHAKDDLEQIWLYSAEQWGKAQAARYLSQLFRSLNQLAQNPALGIKRDDVRAGYFSFSVLQHRVFYLQDVRGIDVVAIIHQRMDVKSANI
ncbi:type II toxin-antitoxin system RelE/ParE family toxin [Rheinheimera sp.]|uniref:type II toxin-antitoxin system RelE/ParE family toxin n=1 Tax=Rheinheimera sp. TaxID=1869214 RepID=UPI00273680EA|nr:type II toxin-antitoxin system RelE/ParE family toxin [Rheinheimera sp.]MDP2715412.1 type II toxin-antitoxin system RelE/ParE family toxin [Rheinheimera sp.]